jgi:hypothetical protein
MTERTAMFEDRHTVFGHVRGRRGHLYGPPWVLRILSMPCACAILEVEWMRCR